MTNVPPPSPPQNGPWQPDPGAQQRWYGPGPAVPPGQSPGMPAVQQQGFPAGAPVPVRPAGAGGPVRHRSYTRLVVVGAAVVVGLLVVVSGAGALLYKNRGRVLHTAPPVFRSASSGRPIYHRLPTCDTMPTATLAKLVPHMQNTLHTSAKSANPAIGPSGVCQWDNLEVDNKQPAEDRTVKVTVSGYADYVGTGLDSAKQSFDDARSKANQIAGKTVGDHTYGPVQELSGAGGDAFAQNYAVRSTLVYGGTLAYLRIDNLMVQVDYDGADGPDSQRTPISAAQAYQGVQDVARDISTWLSLCAACKS